MPSCFPLIKIASDELSHMQNQQYRAVCVCQREIERVREAALKTTDL